MISPSPPFIYDYVGTNFKGPSGLEDHPKIQSAIYALFQLIYTDVVNSKEEELKERSQWERYIPAHSMNMRRYIIPACERLGYDPVIIYKKILDTIYMDENDIAWYKR